jgi:hypothetical protein
MKWRKLGRVFCPDREFPWMINHAAVPVAEYLHDDEFIIYFASRDSANRSHIGWVRIDLSDPTAVLEISTQPVLSPGELGCFDDSGAMPTWIARVEESRYLYYIGWNLGVTVPFRNAIGLAVSEGPREFKRFAKGPIVDRTAREPHFCASCCVIPEENLWRMWYLSCVGWTIEAGSPRHHYHIKYAESDDGIHWRRDCTVAIDFSEPGEYAISRPSVILDRGCWHMWYSYRGDRYRIGYAESEDGISWIRKDADAGIDVSPGEWDGSSVEYPCVFDHEGTKYMLYNGDGYGLTGFGIAVMEA